MITVTLALIAIAALVIYLSAADTYYWVDNGISQFINCTLIGNANLFATLRVALFTNNVVVSKATVLGGLTECTATGYARQNLNAAQWAAPSVSAHVCTVTTTGAITFTFTAGLGQTVYGGYIMDSGGTNFMGCWNLGTPFAIPAGGGTLNVTPTLSSQSLN